MTDEIAMRPFLPDDLKEMDIQNSQRDWATDISREAAEAIAASGTMFAWCSGDRVLAIGGVADMLDRPIFLCVLSDEAKTHRAKLFRQAHLAMSRAKAQGFVELWTYTDIGDQTQARWVSRIGFVPEGREPVGDREMITWRLSAWPSPR